MKHRLLLSYLLGLGFLLFLLSCEEETIDQVSVQTEQIIFSSSDEIRILGRIITTANLEFADHGFYLSTDETFANRERFSLGTKSGPGSFIGVIKPLAVGGSYYIKAYAVLGEDEVSGQIIPFSTNQGQIIDFEPKVGVPGDEMIIRGHNISDDAKVFIGGQEAEILDITFNSRLRLRVPPISEQFASVRIENGDQDLSFEEPFEYIIGRFDQVANFINDTRFFNVVHFFHEGKFIFGLGVDQDFRFLRQMWTFDPLTENWEQIPYNGGNHQDAFFSENYFGGGVGDVATAPIFTSQFYKREGFSFVPLTDLPFETNQSIAFELGDYLYVAGGEKAEARNVDFSRDFRRYHIPDSTWETLPALPFELNNSVSQFTHQGRQYIVNLENQLVSFNPGDLSWQVINEYPGSITRGFGKAAVSGNRAFIGLYNRSGEVWELDLSTLEWREKLPFRGNNFAFSYGIFEYQGLIYFLRSRDRTSPTSGRMGIWSFEPDAF